MGKCAYDWQDLQFGFFPCRELLKGQLETLALNAEASRHGMSGSHPDVWVGSVLDFGTNCEALQVGREDVKHDFARDKRSRAKRNLELVASPIVVSTDLVRALGYSDTIKGGDLWRVEIVQCSIDVPSVEASDALSVILGRDHGLVEGRVTGVLEARLGETFVVVYHAIANQLHLRYRGDGLEIWVKNGLLRFTGFVVAVAVALRLGVESLVISIRRTVGQSSSLITYLCQSILLSGSDLDISEEKSTML